MSRASARMTEMMAEEIAELRERQAKLLEAAKWMQKYCSMTFKGIESWNVEYARAAAAIAEETK